MTTANPFDNLFEQINTLNKAAGYDILLKQVVELKSDKEKLVEVLTTIKNTLSAWNGEGNYTNLIEYANTSIKNHGH